YGEASAATSAITTSAADALRKAAVLAGVVTASRADAADVHARRAAAAAPARQEGAVLARAPLLLGRRRWHLKDTGRLAAGLRRMGALGVRAATDVETSAPLAARAAGVEELPGRARPRLAWGRRFARGRRCRLRCHALRRRGRRAHGA